MPYLTADLTPSSILTTADNHVKIIHGYGVCINDLFDFAKRYYQHIPTYFDCVLKRMSKSGDAALNIKTWHDDTLLQQKLYARNLQLHLPQTQPQTYLYVQMIPTVTKQAYKVKTTGYREMNQVLADGLRLLFKLDTTADNHQLETHLLNEILTKFTEHCAGYLETIDYD